MPRRARLASPGIPWYIIQRGNNRSAFARITMREIAASRYALLAMTFPRSRGVPPPSDV